MSLTISTKLGNIVLALRRDAAPVTADYIAKLCDQHKLYHNSTCKCLASQRVQDSNFLPLCAYDVFTGVCVCAYQSTAPTS